jgi:hypothetical protein
LTLSTSAEIVLTLAKAIRTGVVGGVFMLMVELKIGFATNRPPPMPNTMATRVLLVSFMALLRS